MQTRSIPFVISGIGSVLNYSQASYIIIGMRDLIRERNEKEKMDRTVIKWWNVHYMTPEELSEAGDENKKIQTILSRKDQALRDLIEQTERDKK